MLLFYPCPSVKFVHKPVHVQLCCVYCAIVEQLKWSTKSALRLWTFRTTTAVKRRTLTTSHTASPNLEVATALIFGRDRWFSGSEGRWRCCSPPSAIKKLGLAKEKISKTLMRLSEWLTGSEGFIDHGYKECSDMCKDFVPDLNLFFFGVTTMLVSVRRERGSEDVRVNMWW